MLQLTRTNALNRKTHLRAVAQSSHPHLNAVQRIQAKPLSAEVFKPFGQVVYPSFDGKVYDDQDARLVLDKGTPRFYIMTLPKRGLRFNRITYHGQVTQCLGALSPVKSWFLVVSKSSGSVLNYPKIEDLAAFKIPHGVYVKMEMGTWHAGPLFEEAENMDFYNLELSNTNVVDHNTHDYQKSNGFEIEVIDCI